MNLLDKIKLIPHSAPLDDTMYNRRLLAYYGLAFSVYWAHLILAVYVFALYKAQASDAAIIVAFLGVPGTLAGLGFWKYLKAAEKDDEHRNGKTDSGGTDGNISVTTTVESGQPKE